MMASKALPILSLVVVFYSLLQTATAGRRTVLNIVLFVPLPDKDYQPAFDQGHSIIPAVQLAVEQINNRSDIIPGYNLTILLRDSGCDKASKTAVSIVSIFRELLVGRNGPLGMIGPACSEDSIFVANMFRGTFGVPVLHSGTTPLLSKEYKKRPNAFGMVSSTAVLVDVLIKISEKENWNWKNVAVLFDDAREHFQATYDTLVKKLNSTKQIGYTRRITLSSIPLDELMERNIRIVIVFSSKEVTRNLICLAGQQEYNFIYPIHQFIFTEKLPKDILVKSEFIFTYLGNGKTYHCSKQIMLRGLNGSIFLNQALDSVEPHTVTVSNYTARQIKEQYRAKLAEYERLNNLTNLPEHSLAYPYYDATWVVAMGLHFAFMQPYPSIKSYVEGISYNLSFQGVSNWIDFSNQHHVTNPVRILQANGTMAISRGLWNVSTLTYISDTFIGDDFKQEGISVHISLAILGFICVSVILLVTVVLQIVTVVYRNYPSVKAGSAQLNHFIYLGCYLYLAAALSNTVHQAVPSVNGDVFCNINVVSSNLGFSFIFGTTLAKSWRTYRIFHHVFKTSRGHRYLLHDVSLAILILSIVIIEVILFIPVFALSPLKDIKSISYDNSRWPPIKQVKTECVFTSVSYLLLPFLFQLCLGFAAIFLATLNRNVKRKYFETSRQLFMLVYALSIMWAIGEPLLILSVTFKFSINITYSLFLCFLVVTVVLCLIMLIVPSLTPVISRDKISRLSTYLSSIRSDSLKTSSLSGSLYPLSP